MTDEPTNPVTQESEAIERIARSADGALLHRYLRRVLETVYDTPEPSALLAQNGRRSLARDLMRLMAEGVESNSDRTSSTDSAILVRAARPVAVSRARGLARRVGPSPEPIPDEPESGADGSDPPG